MRELATFVLILLFAGCVGRHSTSIQPRSLEGNRLLMSEPTPSDWKVGSVWNFVQFGTNGVAVLDVTFRVTDRPAETCSSGDWRELELIDGQIGNGSAQVRQAYGVSGRLLTLDLTGWCDVGEIQGALQGASFEGQTTGGPFTGGRFKPQKVVGRRLR